jgi:hypothetical protein
VLIKSRPEKPAFEEDGIEIEAELGGVVIRQTSNNPNDYALTRAEWLESLVTILLEKLTESSRLEVSLTGWMNIISESEPRCQTCDLQLSPEIP